MSLLLVLKNTYLLYCLSWSDCPYHYYLYLSIVKYFLLYTILHEVPVTQDTKLPVLYETCYMDTLPRHTCCTDELLTVVCTISVQEIASK